MRPIVLILGPTAGGKTSLAVALAQRLPGGGELICCDSMQVYRGMDIGTAKPTTTERAAARHHVLDLVEPTDEGFTVDRWLEHAEAAIAAIRERGGYPIVVGGTNLYVQALIAGLFSGPAADQELRATLETLDDDALHTRLAEVDADAASRIHRRDRRRAIRAIEVFEITGRPISDLQTQWPSGRVRADVKIIGLEWPVAAINARINARVRAMMDAGLLEEVRSLQGQLGAQAAVALGYRQLLDHFEGRMTLEEAVEEIKIRTRRYAKQQRTWLRRFRPHEGSTWLSADELSPQELVEESLTAILGPLSPKGKIPGTAVDPPAPAS